MKKTICMIIFLLLTSTSAWSLTIFGDTANSTENLGNFIGELTYTYNDNANAQLLVELTNTSPASNGGFITAFAFTNPENLINTASLSVSSDPDFGLIGDDSFNDTIAVTPFDPLDIGGASTSSWLGGGNPSGGIAVGDTGTFTFTFTGNNLSSLNEIDFLPALIRFRGFDDDGSDKVPTSTSPVPEPRTMMLLGIGLIGLAGTGRRIKTKK